MWEKARNSSKNSVGYQYKTNRAENIFMDIKSQEKLHYDKNLHQYL